MNDRQITCFLEAARKLNFTRAAESLFLPQPAVSRYISSLEEELGVKLFSRKRNKQIALTTEGRTYFNMFSRFRREFLESSEALHQKQRTLNLGYNCGWDLSDFLPRALSLCHEKYTDLAINLNCLDFPHLVDSLLSGTLDAIITMEPYAQKYDGIAMERITTIEQRIIYSDALALSEAPASPGDFYPYDFFLVDDEKIRLMYGQITDYCKPYHFVPKFKTVPNIETVLANVENGLGVALLDQWCQILPSSKIHSIATDTYHPICLAWKAGTDNAAIYSIRQALLQVL